MMIIYLVLAAVFVFLGILMYNGKGLRLIAGLDKDAIKQYDLKKLRIFAGIAMLVFVAPLTLMEIGTVFDNESMEVTGMVILFTWVILIIFCLNSKMLKKA